MPKKRPKTDKTWFHLLFQVAFHNLLSFWGYAIYEFAIFWNTQTGCGPQDSDIAIFLWLNKLWFSGRYFPNSSSWGETKPTNITLGHHPEPCLFGDTCPSTATRGRAGRRRDRSPVSQWTGIYCWTTFLVSFLGRWTWVMWGFTSFVPILTWLYTLMISYYVKVVSQDFSCLHPQKPTKHIKQGTGLQFESHLHVCKKSPNLCFIVVKLQGIQGFCGGMGYGHESHQGASTKKQTCGFLMEMTDDHPQTVHPFDHAQKKPWFGLIWQSSMVSSVEFPIWLVVWLPFFKFSQKYWVSVIIPIDEIHHFSEGWRKTTNQP